MWSPFLSSKSATKQNGASLMTGDMCHLHLTRASQSPGSILRFRWNSPLPAGTSVPSIVQNFSVPFAGHIIELEHVAASLAGTSGLLRGIARIIGLGLPQLGRVRKEKNFEDVMKLFAGIDQGKLPPLTGLAALPATARRYAAMDAWCTLRAWERLISQAEADADGSAAPVAPTVKAKFSGPRRSPTAADGGHPAQSAAAG